jgi:hypothetical protein
VLGLSLVGVLGCACFVLDLHVAVLPFCACLALGLCLEIAGVFLSVCCACHALVQCCTLALLHHIAKLVKVATSSLRPCDCDWTATVRCRCTAGLQQHRANVLLDYITTVPVYCWTATVPCQCTAGLQQCGANVLLDCNSTVPIYCWTSTVPCQCTAGLQ